MNEDDYKALIGAVTAGLFANRVIDSTASVAERHRIAASIAKGIREQFELARKRRLPAEPGAVVSVPLNEQLSSLYVRARDGEWHCSANRVDPAWLGRYVARRGFEVVT